MSASKNTTWMPMYWGDYIRVTSHLGATEHGAYLMLIAYYWSTGGPPPDDDRRLWRIACCDSMNHWVEHVRPTIEEFFVIGPEGWFHNRVDVELRRTEAISQKRAKASKLGVEKRREKAAARRPNAVSRALPDDPPPDQPNGLPSEQRLVTPNRVDKTPVFSPGAPEIVGEDLLSEYEAMTNILGDNKLSSLGEPDDKPDGQPAGQPVDTAIGDTNDKQDDQALVDRVVDTVTVTDSSDDKSSGGEPPEEGQDDLLAIPLNMVALAKEDPRKALFDFALPWVIKITGKRMGQLRPLFGKWLKDVDDDGRWLYDKLADAQNDQVADPVGWITKTIQQRKLNGGEHQAKLSEDFDADDWDVRVAGFIDKGLWSDEWGPKPGQSGCRAPGHSPDR